MHTITISKKQSYVFEGEKGEYMRRFEERKGKGEMFYLKKRKKKRKAAKI